MRVGEAGGQEQWEGKRAGNHKLKVSRKSSMSSWSMGSLAPSLTSLVFTNMYMQTCIRVAINQKKELEHQNQLSKSFDALFVHPH